MSRRILVRHGQSRYNAGESEEFDSDVTERGNYQIQEAALHVKEVMGWEWSPHEEPHNWIGFVSPYLRCLKTASPINRRFDVPIVVDMRIGEVPDDLQKSLKRGIVPSRLVDFPRYDWRGFPRQGIDVANREMQEYRADLEAFARILPEDAIVISHMTTIKDLVEILTGRSVKTREVPNCSVTLIEDEELVFVGKR